MKKIDGYILLVVGLLAMAVFALVAVVGLYGAASAIVLEADGEGAIAYGLAFIVGVFGAVSILISIAKALADGKIKL